VRVRPPRLATHPDRTRRMGDNGLADGEEGLARGLRDLLRQPPGPPAGGPPFADMKCVMDALREQGIVLTEILERLPDTRGHHHSRTSSKAAARHSKAARAISPRMDHDYTMDEFVEEWQTAEDSPAAPVLEGAAQDDAAKVEPEAKDTCDAGLEGAALDDAVQVEFPGDPNDPPKAKSFIGNFPL